MKLGQPVIYLDNQGKAHDATIARFEDGSKYVTVLVDNEEIPNVPKITSRTTKHCYDPRPQVKQQNIS
jgi:hypothetical protein